MTSDYTIGDRLWDILFCAVFCIMFPFTMLIFGIPLLIIHLKERKNKQTSKKGFGT